MLNKVELMKVEMRNDFNEMLFEYVEHVGEKFDGHTYESIKRRNICLK
jgi:hypothetical protein